MSPLLLLRSRILAAALVVAPGCAMVNETESVSCYAPPEGEACAGEKEAPDRLPMAGQGCTSREVQVEEGPTEETTQAGRRCCYLVVDRRTLSDISLGCGRPVAVGGEVRVASLTTRRPWAM